MKANKLKKIVVVANAVDYESHVAVVACSLVCPAIAANVHRY